MNDWVDNMLNRPLAGIPTRAWIRFLKENKV